MKRLNGFFSILVLTSILTSCSSEDVNLIQPVNQNNQQVTVQSAQGLKTFYSKVVDKTFTLLDKDKNKSISMDEFMLRTSAGALPQGIQRTEQQSTDSAVTERSPGNSPVDSKNLFTQVDANRNGKISLTEARKNSRLFLGMTKTQLRELVGKTMFGSYDKNSDKYISKQEFLGDTVINSDARTSTLLTSLFYNSDKNADNRLSFAEFEDFAYSMIKSLWDNPAPAPVPTEPTQPSEPTAPTDPAQPNPPSENPAPTDPAPVPAEPNQPSEPTAPTDVI
jgi:Ca2+-binding EF-hand superfamily protein